MSSKSQKRQRLIAFIFVDTMQYPRTLNNSIYHSNKREPLPFFIWIPILVHSVDKTHFLVVAVELIWLLFLNFFFQLFSKTKQISQVHKIQKKLCKSHYCASKLPLSNYLSQYSRLFLNFLYYLELSATVLQNCRITAFAEL